MVPGRAQKRVGVMYILVTIFKDTFYIINSYTFVPIPLYSIFLKNDITRQMRILKAHHAIYECR